MSKDKLPGKRKPWDHGGKTRQQQGYGAAWDKLRKVILQRDEYLCQPCREAGRLSLAQAVDHILAKANGGTDEPDNLRAICNPCHTEKTIRDKGQTPRIRQRIGADGWPVK